jgi:hypothetical protein
VRSLPSPAIRALRVPANADEPCTIVHLELTAAAISDAIGGGLLDDVRSGAGERSVNLYLDEDRLRKGLPDNGRAAVLVARLGCVDRTFLAGLCGDVLVTGADGDGNDADLPPTVLVAAEQSGIRVGRAATSDADAVDPAVARW